MAKVETVQIVDDLTGKTLDGEDINRIKFAVDGKEYLLEVSNANAEKFYAAMEKWVAAAQPVKKGRSKRLSRAKEIRAVRAWAIENGYEVSERGRVPNDILEAYQEAN